MQGLKENVCLGKHIPAGTGLKRYRNMGLMYKGKPVGEQSADDLSEFAPEELQDLEKMIPKHES